MNFDLSGAAKFLEKYWYKKSGLAGALVFIGISVGIILATARASWPIATGVLITSWLGVFVVWCLSHRVPKTKKNHIGFVISITCEDDDESRRIREDFIFPLRQLLRSSETDQSFHFIQFPQHLASQIHDHGDAEKLRAKTRAHFILYGRVRERVLDGKEQHIIEFDGIVAHKPIPEKTSQILAREFSELLPRRVNILKENDLLSFKFTSDWAGVVAEYIIGIAAAVSGDLDHAEKLYRAASEQLKNQDQRFPIYAKLVERIPIRISELYETRAGLAYQEWCDTRDPNLIDEVGSHLEKVVDQHKGEFSILILNAVLAFVKYRDTEKALAYLKKIKGASKGSALPNLVGTWNYNIAFLYAYEGNLQTAIRHYRKGALAVVEPDIISQIESFLCWVLEQEPEKYQLSYALGFFNWKTKGDTVQAKKDFDKFLAERRENEFEKEKDLIEKWVAEMGSCPIVGGNSFSA